MISEKKKGRRSTHTIAAAALTVRLNGFRVQILILLRDIEFAIGEPIEKDKKSWLCNVPVKMNLDGGARIGLGETVMANDEKGVFDGLLEDYTALAWGLVLCRSLSLGSFSFLGVVSLANLNTP
jgi:hypothetical protein